MNALAHVRPPAVPQVLAAELAPHLQLLIRHYQAAAQAPNTALTYASQLRNFEAWCVAQDLRCQFPLPPLIVAAWLAQRANRGSRRSTIDVALAAIKFAHTSAGIHFDTHDPDLRRVIAGIRRTNRLAPRQAAPLRSGLLQTVLAGLGEAKRDRRDAAMLASLYMFALRRSELAGLDYQAIGSGDGCIRLSTTALEVTLLKSKSGQDCPVTVCVPRQANPVCTAAIERWIKCAALGPGEPFMRSFQGRGGIDGRLTCDGISHAVKSAMLRHFLACGVSIDRARALAASFSGHSGRVGLVVSAQEAGAPDTAIARITRHKCHRMIARYGKTADQLLTAPHRLPGVGI